MQNLSLPSLKGSCTNAQVSQVIASSSHVEAEAVRLSCSQGCTGKETTVMLITSACAACDADEIHMPYSTVAQALGTPTAAGLPITYRVVRSRHSGSVR